MLSTSLRWLLFCLLAGLFLPSLGPVQADDVFDWPLGLSVDGKFVPGHSMHVMQTYSNHHACVDGQKRADYGRWKEITEQNKCCAAGTGCGDCCNGSYPCRKCFNDPNYAHISAVLAPDTAGAPQYRVHAGIDLIVRNNLNQNVSQNDPVYAAADGTVHCANTSINYPGDVIVLKHSIDGETLYTMYGHLDVDADLVPDPGETITVSRGDQLGSVVFQSGNNSHLHFEVREFGTPSSGPTCAGAGYTTAGVDDPASDDYRDPVPVYWNEDNRRDFPVMIRVRPQGQLNVRERPTTSSPVVQTDAGTDRRLEPSANVVAVGRSADESAAQKYWYEVQYDPDDNATGYIASYFVGTNAWSGTIYSNEQDDWSCGLPCEQCILTERHDVLVNYSQWGWNVACQNLPAVVDDWCDNLDPAACSTVRNGACAASCGAGACGDACTDCVLQARSDVLSSYATWGWDTSCGNRPNIVDDWCTNLDPTACNDVKAGQCSSSCSTQGCGNNCAECVLGVRPDVLSNYGIWGWDTSCSSYPAIVDDWCANLDPGACAAIKANQCSSTCGADSCGSPCAECVLTHRWDVLENYGLWGWDTSCSSYPAIVDDWCNNLDPAACNDVQSNLCSSVCSAPPACNDACATCILDERPDVLQNYGTWGWDTSCANHPAIVEDWCDNLDPAACLGLRTNNCAAACGPASCGNSCEECVLAQRPDVLENYGLWGWDTSCSSYPAIVGDWCSNLDPAACDTERQGACSASCPVGPGPGPLPSPNADIETSASGPYGPIDGWGPNGAWANHAQFPAGNNGGLGQRFGYYSAGTSETVGQVLTDRYAASTTYTFAATVIGGGNRSGRVPLQIGYAATDGDLASFVLLASSLYDLTGNTSWLTVPGVSHTTTTSGAELGRQIVVRFGSGADGGSSDIWFDNLTVTSGGAPVPPVAMTPPSNAGFESNTSGPFGPLAGWGPNGAWASHAQFVAGNNGSLGASFGYYSAGTTESVGQVLADRFTAGVSYTFRSWAIGGGNRTGVVPYQIGYAATDGDLASFVPLATQTFDLTGNNGWTQPSGVTHTSTIGGPEIGRQIIVRFGNSTDGGSSDIWFDGITVDAQ